MPKAFISCMTTTKKHTIFTGKNALWQALFYDKVGRVGTPDELYASRFKLRDSSSWGHDRAKSANSVSGTEVIGEGVHAKMYTLPPGSVILSSQNNGASPLFEFAVLYQGKGGKMWELVSFVKSSIARASSYSDWWRSNKKWSPLRGGRK